MYGGMIVSANPFQIEGNNGKAYIRERGGVGGINLKNPEVELIKKKRVKSWLIMINKSFGGVAGI